MEQQSFSRVLGRSLIWVVVWALVFFVLAGGFDAPWGFLRRLLLGITLLLQFGWEPDRRSPIEFGRGPRPRGFGTATLRFLLPLLAALLGSTLLAVARYANQQEREVIRAEEH